MEQSKHELQVLLQEVPAERVDGPSFWYEEKPFYCVSRSYTGRAEAISALKKLTGTVFIWAVTRPLSPFGASLYTVFFANKPGLPPHV